MDTRVFVVRPKRFLSNLLLILTEFFKVLSYKIHSNIRPKKFKKLQIISKVVSLRYASLILPIGNILMINDHLFWFPILIFVQCNCARVATTTNITVFINIFRQLRKFLQLLLIYVCRRRFRWQNFRAPSLIKSRPLFLAAALVAFQF